MLINPYKSPNPPELTTTQTFRNTVVIIALLLLEAWTTTVLGSTTALGPLGKRNAGYINIWYLMLVDQNV
jgi:hypothetical protein